MILTPDQYHTIRPGDVITKSHTFRGVRTVETINVSEISDLAFMGYYGVVNEEGFILILNLDETEYDDVEVALERPTLPPPTAPVIVAYQIRHNKIEFGRKMVKVSDNSYSSISRSGVLIKDQSTPAEEITDYEVVEFPTKAKDY